MAVIINDFEVDVQPPQTREESPAATPNQTQLPPPALKPQDIYQIMRRRRSRRLRVRAH